MSSTHKKKTVFPVDESPPLYFVTIKIPAQPKIRIRIPRLLSKTIHKRRSDAEPGKFRKLRSVLGNAMKKAGFGLETESDKSRPVIGLRKRGERFVRVSKRVLRSRVSKRMTWQVRKMRAKKGKLKLNLRVLDLLKRSRVGEEKPGLELCKKRILMGGKCKPLSALHYDKNGVLLPEEFA